MRLLGVPRLPLPPLVLALGLLGTALARRIPFLPLSLFPRLPPLFPPLLLPRLFSPPLLLFSFLPDPPLSVWRSPFSFSLSIHGLRSFCNESVCVMLCIFVFHCHSLSLDSELPLLGTALAQQIPSPRMSLLPMLPSSAFFLLLCLSPLPLPFCTPSVFVAMNLRPSRMPASIQVYCSIKLVVCLRHDCMMC
jgi:hypothetical protein